jgi:hypothetical protein
MQISLDAYLDYLRFHGCDPEITNLHIARDSFYNLKACKLPCGKVVLSTDEVNPFIDQVEVSHLESRTYFTFYILDKGVKIYADPAFLFLGDYNSQGFGEIPIDYLKEVVVESIQDVHEETVKRVVDYFANHPPVNW